MLRQLGYEAELAHSGAEVIRALNARAYDIVFMDLHMPGMDGFAATRYILEHWPESERPVIIAMTADAMHGDRERCLAAGMHDYVSKPVTLDELYEVLSRWGASRT
jgi:CheY-like chemotaxis protein